MHLKRRAKKRTQVYPQHLVGKRYLLASLESCAGYADKENEISKVSTLPMRTLAQPIKVEHALKPRIPLYDCATCENATPAKENTPHC